MGQVELFGIGQFNIPKKCHVECKNDRLETCDEMSNQINSSISSGDMV